jgi:hypothetical protein
MDVDGAVGEVGAVGHSGTDLGVAGVTVVAEETPVWMFLTFMSV